MIYLSHNLFIHSSADGHVGCLHIRRSWLLCMNIVLQVSLQVSVFFFGGRINTQMATHSSVLAWRIPMDR